MRINIWNDHAGRDELEGVAFLSLLKLGMLIWVGVLAIGISVMEFFKPDFFNFPYWNIPFTWDNVWKFYPLFLVGLGWNVLSFFFNRETSSRYDEKILAAESLGYVLTGLWEELLYRWAWIPYAMIGLWCLNWFWGFGLPYGLGIAGVIGGCIFLYNALRGHGGWQDVLVGLIMLSVAGLLFWVGITVNPIFWFFGNVLIPIADWTTFHMMGTAFTHPTDTLFLMAIFATNSAFRDGHKYQGPVGWVNSWYAGMVMIYATLNYGILTAIIIHAIYDIIFAVMKYISRKM